MKTIENTIRRILTIVVALCVLIVGVEAGMLLAYYYYSLQEQSSKDPPIEISI